MNLPPLRLRWSDFDRSGQVPFKSPVREELIRDQILDRLAFRSDALAIWHEPKIKLARRGGKLVCHTPANRHFRVGTPDIIGSIAGRPLGIEVKRPKAVGAEPGRPSPEQIQFMHEARRAKWICFFAWRLEDVETCLQEFNLHMATQT